MLDLGKNLLFEYQDLLIAIGAISAIIFVASLALLPWMLGKISANYFVKSKVKTKIKNPWQLLVAALKTLAAILLLIAGIIMLITPGQGIATILLALLLLEFPGKRSLELKIINNNSTFKTLNWLRSKAGKPPFKR
ncbi:MAG: hypothetical protein FXV79_04550 [Candidatus Thioglobus sp.]|nr:MAG: hypothetical protein FXV80_01710 [Candidatus Thioglobus sp.]KAA0448947.1 MAG: hypothetical protein FXV79_04550 [Candidatus Thioglobus sp.]